MGYFQESERLQMASIVGLIVCAVLTAQSWVLSRVDPYGCKSLLETGAWTDASLGQGGTLQSEPQWQPDGCRMAYYKSKEINECLNGRKIVFVGDSTMRQIFWAAAAYLNPDEAYSRMATAEKHSDQLIKAEEVTLHYIWDTWISGDKLQRELEAMSRSRSGDDGPTAQDQNDGPALLLVGTPALWAAAFTGGEHVHLFKQATSKMENFTHETLDQSIGAQDGVLEDQMLVVPVLYPRYEDLNEERRKSITPDKLEHMNSLLAESSIETVSRVLWSYNKLAYGLNGSHDEMGVHMNAQIALTQFQIALNVRCNSHFAQKTPPKGTCCARPPPLTKLKQASAITLGVLAWIRVAAAGLVRPKPAELAILYLVLMLGWSWVADRSGALTSIERCFESWVFSGLTSIWIATALVGPKSTISSAKSDISVAEFLPREQSDELKGLMQGVILIYHYTHSSKVLPIYKVIRLFISTYIFLSAYGQSMGILNDIRKQKPGDTSVPESLTVRHAIAVLFRLNLLCVLYPFSMATTNYASYYFAPCVSFWFIITWLTLRIGFKKNLRPPALYAKVVIALALSQAIIKVPGVLEYLSRMCDWHRGLSWSAKEMRFRLSLESIAPFAGTLFAAWNSQQATCGETRRSNHHQSNGRSIKIAPTAYAVSSWVVAGSLLTVALYAVVFILPSPLGVGQALDKYAYNVIHCYIFPSIAIALITLRNATPRLRSRYLRLPASLGRISLETYVLQYHTWLANDATSLLSLGLVDRFQGPLSGLAVLRTWVHPVARGFEACLLTACFLTLANLAHWSTRVLGQSMFGRRNDYGASGSDAAKAQKEA